MSETANEVVEKISLALDEPGEEQYDVASVSPEAEKEEVGQVSETANEVVEKRSLALDEPGEEQYDVASVSAEAGEVYINEEELLRLLKATAEAVEDALENVEDLKKAIINFYEALSKLDVVEDAERSGGRQKQELVILSIKRFKQMAMQRLADTLIDFKAQVNFILYKWIVAVSFFSVYVLHWHLLLSS